MRRPQTAPAAGTRDRVAPRFMASTGRVSTFRGAAVVALIASEQAAAAHLALAEMHAEEASEHALRRRLTERKGVAAVPKLPARNRRGSTADAAREAHAAALAAAAAASDAAAALQDHHVRKLAVDHKHAAAADEAALASARDAARARVLQSRRKRRWRTGGMFVERQVATLQAHARGQRARRQLDAQRDYARTRGLALHDVVRARVGVARLEAVARAKYAARATRCALRLLDQLDDDHANAAALCEGAGGGAVAAEAAEQVLDKEDEAYELEKTGWSELHSEVRISKSRSSK